MAIGRQAAAVDALQKAYDAGGRNVDVGLDLAEAMIVAEDGKLDARAKPLLDASLTADPNNAKALWYSGVIALRAKDVETAKRRWTAMLALNPPASVRDILVRQLISMGATPDSLGVTGPSAGAPPGGAQATASLPSGRTIDVRVAIAPALEARVTPGVALFVSARQPGIPGPPLAALRMMTDRWPVSLQLSDANAMIAGHNLSSVDEVEVTARVAFGGTAMTTAGDLVGRALRRRDDNGPLDIRIDTVAQ
jgi:cytochrome c-type biogenesis protein CcmH